MMQRRRLVAPRRKLRPQMVMTNHHNLSSIRGSSLHQNKNLCPTKDLGESKNGAKVFHQSLSQLIHHPSHWHTFQSKKWIASAVGEDRWEGGSNFSVGSTDAASSGNQRVCSQGDCQWDGRQSFFSHDWCGMVLPLRHPTPQILRTKCDLFEIWWVFLRPPLSNVSL